MRRLQLDQVGAMWATGLLGAGVGAVQVLPSAFWWMSWTAAWGALLLRTHWLRLEKEDK